MKIAIAQIDCSLGDIASNCAKIPLYAKRAKEQGCDGIVFPEMIDTGYEMHTVQQVASSWTDQPFAVAKGAAGDSGMYLICGLSEREGEKIYNSIAVFDPAGSLTGKYRKTHLLSLDPVNEDHYLTAGDSVETVEIGGMKWGLSICYDLRFPEVSRSLMRRGAEVIVVCAAWPFPRQSHWKTLTAARAIENQSYVIATNRVGVDGPITFCGSSCIVDPYGNIIASGSDTSEELLAAEITQEAVTTLRQDMPIVKSRREDLYRLWESG